MVNMYNLTIPFVKNAFSDTSMHYNSFWEKISFLSRALKQKAIHGQECYQTLNSGCNRHLMADVALPNHFCFSKDIKNKSNYECKTTNLSTLRKLLQRPWTYNYCYSIDFHWLTLRNYRLLVIMISNSLSTIILKDRI